MNGWSLHLMISIIPACTCKKYIYSYKVHGWHDFLLILNQGAGRMYKIYYNVGGGGGEHCKTAQKYV